MPRPSLPIRRKTILAQNHATDSPDAIVWGAKAIGSVIGRNERQTFHLLENGALRGARKVRGIWSAKRSALLAQWDGVGSGE
jgi:hypothetical protein